jgi:hypothetical protein
MQALRLGMEYGQTPLYDEITCNLKKKPSHLPTLIKTSTNVNTSKKGYLNFNVTP